MEFANSFNYCELQDFRSSRRAGTRRVVGPYA